MKFEDCVISCFNNREFILQYDRLSGSHIGKMAPPKSPIEAMIDRATGFGFSDSAIDPNEAHEFLRFVHDFIWIPVLMEEAISGAKPQSSSPPPRRNQ